MDALKESVTAMAEILNVRMNEFQRDLRKTASPATISTLADYTSFKNFIHIALSLYIQCFCHHHMLVPQSHFLSDPYFEILVDW